MAKNDVMYDQELGQALTEGSKAVCGSIAANFGPQGRNTMCVLY